MRRSDSGCAEAIPLRIVPETGKSREHSVQSVKSDAWHILKGHVGRVDLSDDPLDLGPEPSLVGFAELLPGGGERLAREARADDIHAATPRAAIEGAEIVPNRILISGRSLAAREAGRGVGLPLNSNHSSISGAEGESESEIEASDPSAEAESINRAGTKSHIIPP